MHNSGKPIFGREDNDCICRLLEAPANSVPAAAVRQVGLVLFYVIRRKGYVDSS